MAMIQHPLAQPTENGEYKGFELVQRGTSPHATHHCVFHYEKKSIELTVNDRGHHYVEVPQPATA